MGDRYTNIAKGSSSVHAQIGRVHGDVRFGSRADDLSTKDLPSMLDTLRDEVDAARRRGEIDDATAEAFVEEIDQAASHLPVTDERSSTGFVVAMKKAKGLVEGLAGLTTTVGEAISVVQGIS